MNSKAKKSTVKISDSIGSVSILELVPKKCLALLVLAHGAGANMEHSFMEKLAMDLSSLGIGTIRFNFPYMENRKGRPDVPAVAEKTIAVIGEYAHKKFSKLPLFLSGKSFGGRMGSQRIAKECPDYVKGLIFYGFPLHAMGKESTHRAAHLNEINIPMLFLQGTKDKLAKLELIQKVCSQLPTATLEIIEGADHSFKVPKKLPEPNLNELSKDWIDSVLVK